jgi:catechol 2,3-dioxygenase-like lactoylglutathione lyase family enzyme
MQVTGLGWAAVHTEDYEETLHFFSEILGLSLEYRDEAKELAHFWLPSGQLLEVFGPSNRQRKEKYRWFSGRAPLEVFGSNNSWGKLMSQITIAFEVEDVWQTRAGMEEMSVEFVSDVEVTSIGEVFTYFRGPDGYLYEIWTQV